MKLKHAVAEGEISEDDARKRLEALRQAMAGDRDGEREAGMLRRIRGALLEADIEREVIRDVMGAMRRTVAEVQSEGNAFELDPRMKAHLEELGLTAEQITVVVGLSQRLADAGGDRNVERGVTRTDWEAIKRRIESAVQRGDMTREEADALSKGIRERMTGGGERDSKPVERRERR